MIRAELRAARAVGAKLVCQGSDAYPSLLDEIDDAPPFLWAIGNTALLSRPMVAIVGARNASSLGTRMARGLARDLGAAGFVVVSGLARGVDASAHGATLGTGTIAVMAGGVDVIYPAENTELALSIEDHGLRISEQPMGLQPMARHFPSRNRIISGLARATIVVEAAAKSGSLITARDALDQGREVFAVPGSPMDARASGCNMLIRDGARLVRGVDDILEALPPMEADTPVQTELALEQPPQGYPGLSEARPRLNLRRVADLHRQILARLGPSPTAEDQLVRDLGQGAEHVSSALTDLELDGQVRRQPGGFLSSVPKD